MTGAPVKTKVVDCDTHFWQPLELWQEYIDPAYRQRIIDINPTPMDPEKKKLLLATATTSAPSSSAPVEPAPGGKPVFIDGHVGGARFSLDAQNIRGGDHPVERLQWMDSEGIDTCIIYCGSAAIVYNPDVDIAAAACRALNRWAVDFASHAPDRLKPCMVLPWYDPERALRELNSALELGMRVAFATPTPTVNYRWSDRAYDQLWRALEANGVTMTFHEFTRLPGTPNNIVRNSYRAVHAMLYLCGHTVEAQLTLMDLIFGGVFSRFPKLKFGFVEAHTAWLPGWLAMLDQQWPRALSTFKNLAEWGDTDLGPTDLFRRQGFVVSFPDDKWIGETVQFIGAGNVVISTDYPHPQTRYQLVQQYDDNCGGLGEEVRRKILGENAVRIYGLKG
jgi:predicted TIM-barrel fold metal-dependent hydrolase